MTSTFRSQLKSKNLLPFLPELDVFGIILYALLTFMASVSMLVFIEECIYVYRKAPNNKKSVIIWVNGAAPVREAHSWEDCTTHIEDLISSSSVSTGLFFRWSVPCRVWACGSPEPPCLLTWPLLGESRFCRTHLPSLTALQCTDSQSER